MTGESVPGLPGPTPESLEAFRQNYLAAFLRYLARRDETALRAGYELGRSAVADRLGLLEVAGVHHDVFLHVLSTVSAEELTDVGRAASEFFLEVLATYDMAQKVFLDGPGQDAP